MNGQERAAYLKDPVEVVARLDRCQQFLVDVLRAKELLCPNDLEAQVTLGCLAAHGVVLVQEMACVVTDRRFHLGVLVEGGQPPFRVPS